MGKPSRAALDEMMVRPLRVVSHIRGEPWTDLLALGRTVGFAGRIPDVRRRANEYVAEYQRVVAPIFEARLEDVGPHPYLGKSMQETCVQTCFMLAAYATTAHVPVRADVALLGAAVARVYDDLIDDDGDDENVARLAELFRSGCFSPKNPFEWLLAALFSELEQRLGRERDDPIYSAAMALHQGQTRSRKQRDPAVSSAVLKEITQAKGGHGTVVLFALMVPAMGDREVALIRDLGTVLQLVDDYKDAAADRKNGIVTLVTNGSVSFDQICRHLRALRPALRAQYGCEQPLCSAIYLYLWFAFLRRRLPRFLTERSPAGGAALSTLARRHPERRSRDRAAR